MWGIFHKVMSVPHNNVMDLNNVMPIVHFLMYVFSKINNVLVHIVSYIYVCVWGT